MDQTTQLLMKYLSVAFTAGFGYIMIDLYRSEHLQWYIAVDKFGWLVLGGGILLCLIAFLNLVALGRGHDHHHHHDHDHGHGHDHGHHHGHGHDHAHDGHDHSHGTSPWRLMILVCPLMIVLLNLAPNPYLSADALLARGSAALNNALANLGEIKLPDDKKDVDLKATPEPLDWQYLERARTDRSKRQYLESLKKPVTIAGQFAPDGRFVDRYQLRIFKMTCCASDATPMGVNIKAREQIGTWPTGQWLEVLGIVTFAESKDPNTGEVTWTPIIHETVAVETARRPYLN